MRKKLTIAIATLTAAIFAAFTTTFSWFVAKNAVTFPSSFGSAQTAYFSGGDGSKDNPYRIGSPVHLYNLAWLQYLGYFNLKEGFNNGRAQSFFVLEQSIDCNLSIPPIGTEQYPFVGNFDGNGKVISSVTVSNHGSDLTRCPVNASFSSGNVLSMSLNGGYSSDVSVMGLFGVVGDYNTFVADHYNSGVTVHGKIDDPGDEPTAVGADEFYYSAMTVKNFYINDLHVKSRSAETLVGLAAGYVCANVQNVGAYACDVSLSGTMSGLSKAKNASGEEHDYETTVSKYSIVGDYDENIVGWEEKPTETGGGASWGGSIDMRTLNRRLTYMTASVVTTKPSGYSYSAVNENWGIALYRGSSSEFYWNADSDSYLVAYLDSGTILPLNVNKHTMGLDKDAETEIKHNKTGFRYNEYYANNTTESIAIKNTGYIVGGGSKTGGYIPTRVQPLATGSDCYGIYKSLGYSKAQASAQPYEKSNFEMLTIDINGNTYRIQDTVNKDITNSALSSYERKSYTELGFSKNGENYATVRTNFDTAMNGSKMVHGFHFLNKISATQGYDKTEPTTAYLYDKTTEELKKYDKYVFIEGGINFTLAESGTIKTILGAFYSRSDNSLFDLYKVDRDDSGAINSLTRIKNIYKDATGTIVYDPESTDGYTKIFSFENLTEKGEEKLINGAAYYFEIPVLAGDYVIGADKASSLSNAYLMYLDIGANGDDGSADTPSAEKKPYDVTCVDFVSQYTGSSDFSVPRTSENKAYFPSYKDVAFHIALVGTDGSSAAIAYKRDDYDIDPLTADGSNQIATLVRYYASNVTLTATPSDLAKEDEGLKKE